jgi:hypothetical protein
MDLDETSSAEGCKHVDWESPVRPLLGFDHGGALRWCMASLVWIYPAARPTWFQPLGTLWTSSGCYISPPMFISALLSIVMASTSYLLLAEGGAAVVRTEFLLLRLQNTVCKKWSGLGSLEFWFACGTLQAKLHAFGFSGNCARPAVSRKT